MIKDIPGYEGLYAVADYNTGGKVWSHKKKKWIGYKIKRGYMEVQLWKNNKKEKRPTHQLMYETFLGERPEGYDVHHKDGNKLNNTLSNLELIEHGMHIGRHHTGKINSEETRKRMSEAQCKAVVQLDMNTGEFIREYKSRKEAEEVTKISFKSISNCCRKKSKTAGGYKWMDAEEYYKTI